MREIVVDTETTGLDPQDGHRIVEIAAVELVHHVPTGRVFHCYVNPDRDMPDDAFAVHGLSAEFLAGHATFDAVADKFCAFAGVDPLIIHNAEFDLAFLNMELGRLGRAALPNRFIDTLGLARRRFPGAPASLDALCRRFSIDLSEREKHGAEIDCGLLAAVYLELIGGRQPGLDFAAGAVATAVRSASAGVTAIRPPRPHAASAEELAAHRAMLAGVKEPLWLAAAT